MKEIQQDSKESPLTAPLCCTDEGKQFFLSMQKSWLDRAGGSKGVQDRLLRYARIQSKHSTAIEAVMLATQNEVVCREKKLIMAFFCFKDKMISAHGVQEAKESFKEAKEKKMQEEQERDAKKHQKIEKSSKRRRMLMELEEPNFC